jgi:hypothetical protein
VRGGSHARAAPPGIPLPDDAGRQRDDQQLHPEPNDADAHLHVDAHLLPFAHRHADSHGHPHFRAKQHANRWYTDGHPDGNDTESDGHRHEPDSDRQPNGFPHFDRLADPDANHRHADPYLHALVHLHADLHEDTEQDPDLLLRGVLHADGHADPHAFADSDADGDAHAGMRSRAHQAR